jgi:hypothetical protein
MLLYLGKTVCKKNQGREPIHQKYKANESTSRHNPKKKNESKQSTKNKEKKPYANRTQGYKIMINNNKEDLRQESCRLPQIG